MKGMAGKGTEYISSILDESIGPEHRDILRLLDSGDHVYLDHLHSG